MVMRVASGRGGRNEEILVQGYKTSMYKINNCEDLMHRVVIIANNPVLYTWTLLGE